MKWVYKECEVEITAVHDSPAQFWLTPIVEIDCAPAGIVVHTLTTKEIFESAVEAELYGQRMAKEWIDENVKNE